MMTAVKEKSGRITEVRREDNSLYLEAEFGTLRLTPVDDDIVRVSFKRDSEWAERRTPGIVGNRSISDWYFSENGKEIVLATKKMKVQVLKESGSCAFYDAEGKLLFSERPFESRSFERFEKKKLAETSQEVVKIQTADGAKDIVKNAVMENDGYAYHIRLHVMFGDEALYGLGQHEEGYASLRGRIVYVHQGNRQIAVPMIVSTKAYGILVNTYSPLIFSDIDDEPYIYCEADSELDYYFIKGNTPNDVVAGYRKLTGKAVMLPKWSFGYVQSQERYETEDEILEVAKKTHEKGIGMDCIVLDWLSWGDNQWGQKTLDKSRFGHYSDMIKKLHEEDVHFMISVWPNSGDGTANNREFSENGLMLPGCGVYNALKKEGRDMYWKQLCEELVPFGTDAWWCDSSEPFTPEWGHMQRVEPSKLFEDYLKEVGTHLPADMLNVFSLHHAQGIFEGQRRDVPEKRVCNLTRSAYIGQQRYGVICWSGDIGASWKTLKNQIPAGLNFSASGLLYWTVDIGAFFVRHGNYWYWDGDFDEAEKDMGYRELFTRWYQWGAFLPVFRTHGTDCRRELWNFGEEGDIFYDALLAANRLRYSLIPYIYSAAGKAWLEDKSIIRFLAFDFPEDRAVYNIKDQYMFGEALMVCPVTEPMYYGKNSEKLENTSKNRKVYLPAGTDWFDLYTGKRFAGGETIEAEADINRIPVFVKDGTILPISKPGLSTADSSEICEYRIFGNGDTEAVLYNDAGDGYGYEDGEYELINLKWSASEKRLYRVFEGNMEPVEGAEIRSF